MDVFATKKYKEAWAAFAMIKAGIIHKPFSIDWLSDRPDLQIGNLGIEVVNAMEPLEGEQQSFQNQLVKCPTFMSAQKLNSTDYFRNSRFKIKPLGETHLPFIYRSSYEEQSLSTTSASDIIIKKIREKSNKFPKYPNSQRFIYKWLFINKTDDIFLETPTIWGDILSTLNVDEIIKTIEESIFDLVVLYLPTKMKIFKKGITQSTDFIFGKNDVHDISLDTLRGIGSDEYERYKEIISHLKNKQ